MPFEHKSSGGGGQGTGGDRLSWNPGTGEGNTLSMYLQYLYWIFGCLLNRTVKEHIDLPSHSFWINMLRLKRSKVNQHGGGVHMHMHMHPMRNLGKKDTRN